MGRFLKFNGGKFYLKKYYTSYQSLQLLTITFNKFYNISDTLFQDIDRTLVKFEQLPHFLEIFSSEPNNSSATNGACSGNESDSPQPTSDTLNNNNNNQQGSEKGLLTPGDIRISGRTYSVTDSAHLFLSILVRSKLRSFNLEIVVEEWEPVETFPGARGSTSKKCFGRGRGGGQSTN